MLFIMTNKENTIEDLTVINRVNTGSDHRLVRARFYFRTRIERAKLVKTQTSKIDYKVLNAHQNLFQLELQNKFKELQVSDDDIESYNQHIIATVNDTAGVIENSRKPIKVDKVSESTKVMLRRRREMKQDATQYNKIE